MNEQEPLRAIIKVSRGRLGGSTFLTALSERVIYAGRPLLMGDGDRHNKGISQSPLYKRHGLPLPQSDDRVTMQEWLTNAFGSAIEQQKNLILDIGGGDDLVQEYASTTNLIEAGEALGITVVGVFMCGTEPGDFDFICQLGDSGKFNPKKSIIVMNEWAAPEGVPPKRAFSGLVTPARLAALGDSEIAQICMPRLLSMNEVHASGLTFHDAAEGRKGTDGRPLGPMQRFWVKRWLEEINTSIIDNGAEAWLP